MRAVTFDLWDTLICEGEAGEGLLRPRSRRWSSILAAEGIDVELGVLDGAHAAALQTYKEAWSANEQFRSSDACRVALEVLGVAPTADVIQRLVAAFHEAGMDSVLDLVPGAVKTLCELRSAGIRTAIISDIGLTPSSALMQHPTVLEVLDLVEVKTWSDEVGRYKPDPYIFACTLERLGVEASEAVHVGDRLRTDVAGARGAGMMSCRFRGVFNDTADLPEADVVVERLDDILSIPGLSGQPSGSRAG